MDKYIWVILATGRSQGKALNYFQNQQPPRNRSGKSILDNIKMTSSMALENYTYPNLLVVQFTLVNLLTTSDGVKEKKLSEVTVK